MFKFHYIMTILIFVKSFKTQCDPSTNVQLYNFQSPINALTLFKTGTYRGKGSFGEVRQITHQGQKLAIKRITIQKTANHNSEYNLAMHEIEILKKLSKKSSNFFPIFYGCGENLTRTSSEIFVIQEILYSDLTKKNSEALINNIPAKSRLHLYLELAEGLSTMHSLNYVHSDMKPENIMMTIAPSPNFSNLHFKIIDFGMTDLTSKYVMGGSPVFNSPEKINSDDFNDKGHDVWAFGLTVAAIESRFTYLFSGVPNECFERRFSQQCGNMILTKVGKVMNEVFGNGTTFTRLVKRCLSYDKRDRPSMREVAEGIKGIITVDKEEINNINMTSTVNHRNKFKFDKKATEEVRRKEKDRVEALRPVVRRGEDYYNNLLREREQRHNEKIAAIREKFDQDVKEIYKGKENLQQQPRYKNERAQVVYDKNQNINKDNFNYKRPVVNDNYRQHQNVPDKYKQVEKNNNDIFKHNQEK